MNHHPYIPDSQLCNRILEYLNDTQPEYLTHHCLRSHAYSALISESKNDNIDQEILFCTTALHDLGLCQHNSQKSRFEVLGADLAVEFLGKNGLDKIKCEIVWDGIALHTSFEIAFRKQAEIANAAAGILFDVVGGPQIRLIGKKNLEKILTMYPRLNLKKNLVNDMVSFIQKNPKTVTGTILSEVAILKTPETNCPNFVDLINRAPFPE
ncbi:HD domain-containing protein [Leptospira sp. WS4.C2]